jgi:hypothetical protein
MPDADKAGGDTAKTRSGVCNARTRVRSGSFLAAVAPHFQSEPK